MWADEVRGVFLIVDGLGGHAAGEKAAATAVEVISRTLDLDAGPVDGQLRQAITAANNEIHRLAAANPEWAGMACVLTIAVLHGGTLTLGHVGDSRLYLLWNGALKKLTSDHSPVGELEDQGELTEAEAMADPRRNEVFRDVGTRPREGSEEDFIEIRSIPFRPDAGILLCSDGLTDALTAAGIAAIVEQYDGDAPRIARLLVDAANQAGGQDNVSVILVAGPEFVGVHSPAMTTARARHAVTRMRRRRRAWRRMAAPLAWLLIGLVMGMAILLIAQKTGGGLR